MVPKVGEGHPDTVERIEAGEVDLVINTVGSDPQSVRDSASIRRSALLRAVPYFTTLAGARAAAGAIRALQLESIGVRALQDIHPGTRAGSS
jgi:carbamoyl-phosphate synthase large subunit